ncbi:MAG TPA: RNA-binding cell elongation regulator Jag/EloR [Actinomycetota bacterium]|nr:RNA-binding cell elongation regulator Jag/EloR [Actinomycetota bacterium]
MTEEPKEEVRADQESAEQGVAEVVAAEPLADDGAEAPEPATDGAEAPEKGAAPSAEASGDDEEPVEPATPEEVAETAQEFLSGLLEQMGLEAEVKVSTEGDSAFVDVTGESLGVLIGRRGQTLDALQELARTAVQRRLRSRARLLVDVEGYRARRRSSLADYAREIAESAKDRGTEIELEPMTAYERKVVHDAVAEVDGATSFSEGEEPNRKVVVRGE